MSDHFNKLSPAEAERLALLLEEMGEAQQIIGKILRHGYESYHPDNREDSNRALLEGEIGDVLAAVKLMVEAKDLREDNVEDARDEKYVRVGKYLHHQPVRGPR